MIYLDNGATSFPKPECVRRAVLRALQCCTNPGRGGYPASASASETVYRCREAAGKLLGCQPEQVVFTGNCTQGLNMAIRTLVKPGSRVVISGFEHNAVTRPLHLLGAKITVAGRKLFDWEDTLAAFEQALKKGQDAAVFTQMSNVFGYILPVGEMAALCKAYGVPFAVDAAQGAGVLPVSLEKWGADFIAMPGHKGLLGPQGTGLLLCSRLPEVLLAGGTGSDSRNDKMPDFLPDRGEAGTLNVPGIAGLGAALEHLSGLDLEKVFAREQTVAALCARRLGQMGFSVFAGPHQGGTVSFCTQEDCETVADSLAAQGIAVRSGLHCAPLAHESAGTLEKGTVRISFGPGAETAQVRALCMALQEKYF